MKLAVIISPYSGDVEDNVAYARACVFDAITQGHLPFASHLFYTQVLDDNNPEHRKMGMSLGHEMIRRADLALVYLDRGKSDGMKEDIAFAHKHRTPIEEHWLSRWNPVG